MHLVTNTTGKCISTHPIETRAKGKTCIICGEKFVTRPLTKRHLDNTSDLKLVFDRGDVEPHSSTVVHKDDKHKKAIVAALQQASKESVRAFNGFCAGHESEEYIKEINNKKNLTK